MVHPDKQSFETHWAAAQETLALRPATSADQAARVALWRRQEFHNWLRWRICRKGFDWSKPLVIALNALGFAALVLYGIQTQKWHVTAGGIVAWFTIVNLSFFTYFGLTLPGPPQANPIALANPGDMFRAEIGVYPAGYERRKLARLRLRVASPDGTNSNFEIALEQIPESLTTLIQHQTMWRMQRADAPLTRAVIQATGATPDAVPFQVIAWSWDQTALQGFLIKPKK